MQYLIFLFLSPWIFESVKACEIDNTVKLALKNKPSQAKTIAIGTVRKNKNDLFLYPKSVLTGDIFKIKIATYQEECDFTIVEEGKKYLVLSSLEIHEGNHSLVLLKDSNSLFIELPDAAPFFEKLIDYKGKSNHTNPAWQYCKSNSDCVLANLCGKKTPLNNLVYSALTKKDQRISTCKSIIKENASSSTCENNFCK